MADKVQTLNGVDKVCAAEAGIRFWFASGAGLNRSGARVQWILNQTVNIFKSQNPGCAIPSRVYPRIHRATRFLLWCTGIGVYPCIHRATGRCHGNTFASLGLSPHTQGNRTSPQNPHIHRGSIPAHTGQPLPSNQLNSRVKVLY